MKYLLPAFFFALSCSVFVPAPVYAQEQEQEEMAPVSESHPVISSANKAPADEESTSPKVGPLKKQKDDLDPVSGPVGPSDVPFYNLYERQVRYKGADEEFRNSIETRRVAFEQPRTASYTEYEAKLSEIYQKENEESLKKISESEKSNDKRKSPFLWAPPSDYEEPQEESASKPNDDRPVVPMGEPGDGMDQAPENLKQQEQVVKEASSSVTSDAAQQDNKKVGIKEIEVQETEQQGEPAKKVIVPEDAPDFEKSPF